MIKRIGVIGAGQMGSGIAHVCALKGFDIRLMDIDQPHINSGVENIGRNMDRQIGRTKVSGETILIASDTWPTSSSAAARGAMFLPTESAAMTMWL